MISKVRRNWRRVRPWTRHSTVLIVAGLVYMFIGASYISEPNAPSRSAALVIALSWMPLTWWGVVFILAGIMSMISAKWPEFMETWGYMVLTGLSACWAAMYATGVIFVHAPTTGWTGAFLWGLIAFLWWAISGLLNPGRVPVVPHGPR